MTRSSKQKARKGWKLLPYPVRRLKARQERDQVVGWLRKKGKSPEAVALAEKLAGCHPMNWCGSGACPICTTIAQEHYATALRNFVGQQKNEGEELFTLTLIPEGNEVPPGTLSGFDLTNFTRRLRARLKPLLIAWGIGGIDLSCNEHDAGRYAAHWSPHLYLIGATENLEALRKALQHLAIKSEANPRPVKVRQWRGGYRAFFYALKPDIFRRVGTDEAKRFAKRAGSVRTCRATTKQRLRSAERLELRICLDRWGSSGRIFSHQCQVHRNGRTYHVRMLD